MGKKIEYSNVKPSLNEKINRKINQKRQAGKGDNPRKVDKEKFDKGWERIFGKK